MNCELAAVFIWFSKDPQKVLGYDLNLERLFVFRKNNPNIPITLIVDQKLLDDESYINLVIFCEKNSVNLYNLEDVKRSLISKTEHELFEYVIQELDHESGNYAAASDIVRLLVIGKKEFGNLYLDFDVKFTKELPKEISVKADFLCSLDIDRWSGQLLINNWILLCNDRKTLVLEKIMDRCLKNYKEQLILEETKSLLEDVDIKNIKFNSIPDLREQVEKIIEDDDDYEDFITVETLFRAGPGVILTIFKEEFSSSNEVYLSGDNWKKNGLQMKDISMEYQLDKRKISVRHEGDISWHPALNKLHQKNQDFLRYGDKKTQLSFFSTNSTQATDSVSVSSDNKGLPRKQF